METDRKTLQSVFQKSVLSALCRLQRTLRRLQGFNSKIKYKHGPRMHIAYCLSRAYLLDPGEQHEEFPGFALEIEPCKPLKASQGVQWVTHSYKRQYIGLALQSIRWTVVVGWPELRRDVPIAVLEYWTYREEFIFITVSCSRICTSLPLRTEIIARSYAIHLGMAECLRNARDVTFFIRTQWPNFAVKITKTCSRKHSATTRHPGLSYWGKETRHWKALDQVQHSKWWLVELRPVYRQLQPFPVFPSRKK